MSIVNNNYPALTNVDKALIRSLVKAVDERGEDYVYASVGTNACWYNQYEDKANELDEHGRPVAPITGVGCIVGYAAQDSGLMSAEKMRRAEGLGAFTLLGRTNGVTHRVVMALDRAQTFQDDGGTWGHARDAALSVLRDDGYDLSFLEVDTLTNV